MTQSENLRTIITVPVAAASMQTGERTVVIDSDLVCHVIVQPASALVASTEMSFTADQAMSIARQVLAGEPRASTSPGALRILAAAFMVCMLTDTDDASEAQVRQ